MCVGGVGGGVSYMVTFSPAASPRTANEVGQASSQKTQTGGERTAVLCVSSCSALVPVKPDFPKVSPLRRLQNGTTYNSFLIFGEDKTALVDASHEKFRELYIDALKDQLKAAGRRIDYIFVSHTEPDHSGMIIPSPPPLPPPCVCQAQDQTLLGFLHQT